MSKAPVLLLIALVTAGAATGCSDDDVFPIVVSSDASDSDSAELTTAEEWAIENGYVPGPEATPCETAFDCNLDQACRFGGCVRVPCDGTSLYCDSLETCAAEGAVLTSDAQDICTQAMGCDFEWAHICFRERPYCDGATDLCPLVTEPQPWTTE